MNFPNVYKAEIGFMDLTINELSDMICERGLYVNPSEVTRAVRGATDPKHYLIRDAISDIFNDWCGEMGENFGLYPQISVSCRIRRHLRKCYHKK